MSLLKKFQGCLIGGAIGDALGYPIEFYSHDNILKKYGPEIKEYVNFYDSAIISDDTQMLLFTASGILTAEESKKIEGLFKGYNCHIYDAYLDWYNTQYNSGADYQYTSWLYEIEKLHKRRAPGTTCTSSLCAGKMGSINYRINDSQGCGGVMRVAPVGLYFSMNKYSDDEIFLLGGESAALTHGNDFAIIPACVLASIISKATYTSKDLLTIVNESLILAKKHFKGEQLRYFVRLIEYAIRLTRNDLDDVFCIEQLGQGWYGHEALAISIYCALKYEHDFVKAVSTSVNHSGDSDSTGSITGNILGAYLGIDSIPDYYKDNVELKDVILNVADDLYGVNEDLAKRYLLKK